jgi:ABC-type sugar transport system permease subunit
MTIATDIPSTNAATGIITRKQPRLRGRRASKWVNKSRLYLILLLLMFPTLAGMLLFTYWPQWETIKYSFYKWDGSKESLEFIGLENFHRAFFIDRKFWPTFQLVGILLVANLFKMWPAILTAVVLHRVRSDRWQYIYRVLFVIPMIIPALVTLLIWKQFFDANTGILNIFLNATGLMSLLQWLDVSMPALASKLAPVVKGTTSALGSVWVLGLLGVMFLSAPKRLGGFAKQWIWWVILGLTGIALWWPASIESNSLSAIVALGWTLGAMALAYLVNRKRTVGLWLAAALLTITSVLVVFGMTWTTPTNSFAGGSPAWLGESKLIIPSLIFWGFPWVGTVGVLIYLAGLQNISADVYEAAEIDGLGSLGKFWSLELPLILTQVRINLIFMTIGTLTDYYLVFLLLGPEGGPGSIGMVPGLYMYKQAFADSQFGYACALGIVLACLILVITVMYQKYVKVDK